MDRHYMQAALNLAEKARGRTSPNPMVGAVIVKAGKVVGSGYHRRAGTPHAEINALNEAGAEAGGATLYVTLEPCCHYGRTGPCTEAVIEAGIARVVVAMEDPNPLVAGRGIERMKAAGIEVDVGVMEDEARELNEVFIKYITTGKPFVTAKAAVSLDGKIAARTGRSKWITSPEARRHGHKLRDGHDAVMVGIGTVLADDPLLTTRLDRSGGRDPVRVILDSRARIPLNARVLNCHSRASAIIAVTADAPRGKLKMLREKGAGVLVVNDGPQVDLVKLVKLLGDKEITSVLIEGGSAVHAAAFNAGLVDKVAWFIAPKVIGGREAPGPVGGTGVDDPSAAVELGRLKVINLGPDLLVEGYVKHNLQQSGW